MAQLHFRFAIRAANYCDGSFHSAHISSPHGPFIMPSSGPPSIFLRTIRAGLKLVWQSAMLSYLSLSNRREQTARHNDDGPEIELTICRQINIIFIASP
jgi:hypothetical protein